MEQQFKKEMESLAAVFEFLGRFMEAHRVDQATAYALSLAVEEFFTNMVKYDARNNDTVTISAVKEAERVRICLVNDDVDPFDVTRVGEVDVTKPLEGRKVGGLGFHLARSTSTTRSKVVGADFLWGSFTRLLARPLDSPRGLLLSCTYSSWQGCRFLFRCRASKRGVSVLGDGI